jgi:hypothetical protein
MNQNGWYVDDFGQYERDRMQRELKQIRLEEKAMKVHQIEEKTDKARVYRPGMFMRIVLTTLKWLIP